MKKTKRGPDHVESHPVRPESHQLLFPHLDQDAVVEQLRDSRRELAKSESTLQTILSAAPVAIGMTRNRIIQTVNKSMLEMLGYERHELIGKSTRILYENDEENERVDAIKYALIRQKGSGSIETRWRCRNGAILDIFLQSQAIDFEDISAGVIFTGVDITELKAYEAELRRNEERFRLAAEASRSIIYEFDLRTSEAPVLHGLKQLLGYEQSGGSYEWWISLIHPEDLSGLYTELRAIHLSGYDHHSFTYRVRDAQGEYRTVQDITYILYENGVPAAHIGSIVDITDRVRAEQVLRESEERFRSAFDKGAVPMAMAAPDSRFIMVNAAFSRMVGYSQSELTGMSFYSISHPDDIPLNKAGVDSVVSGREDTFRMEKRYIRKDGCIIWVDMSTSSVRDAGGKPLYVVTYAQDITERKEMEIRLRESEERFRQLIENQSELICRFNPDGLLTFVNPALCRMAKKSASELLGVSVLSYLDQRDAEDLFNFRKITQYNPERQVTLRAFIAGKAYWIHWTGRALFDDSGNIIEYQAVGRDITDRKLAEENIAKSEERFRSVLESSLDAVFRRNLQTDCYDYISPVIEQLIGYTADEMKNLGISDVLGLIHPDDIPGLLMDMEKANDTGKAHLEYRFRHKNGSYRWLSERDTIQKDEQGQPLYRTGIVRDITEWKAIDDELKTKTVQLEYAVQELESFSYSVSHDLKAPLRAIQGFLNMLFKEHEESFTDKEALRKFNIIKYNIDRMNQLIHDLLCLSSLGRKSLEKTALNMSDLARQTFQELTCIYPDREYAFKLDDLPAASGDPVLIRQVFENLISNAIKFSRKRKNPAVEIGSFNRQGQVVYFVRDNGAGFNMNYYHKMFGIFQRLHTDREFEGTGIGLAVVQRILHRHGGEIWGEGKEDQGATFYFTLPG